MVSFCSKMESEGDKTTLCEWSCCNYRLHLLVVVTLIQTITDRWLSSASAGLRPPTSPKEQKINATPVLEDGKMNIRIENSKRNIYSCKVEISLKNEDIIYTSPMLAPNQSLEYATVDADIPEGSYDGVAVFRYFDGENELEVQSSVKLKINMR